MKAVVLAGGFGTRLRPLSCTRPKILFPIVNKPLLEWIFNRLANNHIEEVILAVNRRTAWYIKQARVPEHGLRVRYSIDPVKSPLGTAGPIKKAEKKIGDKEPFLVLNGDIFAEINYREILKVHLKNEAVCTVALREVEDSSRYGVAELSANNRIKRFVEKPARGKVLSKLINAGVYVMSPHIFRYIQKGRAISMEREIFPQLAKKNLLYGYNIDDLWMDIGKPAEYLEINRIVLAALPLEWNNSTKFEVRNPVAIDSKVRIKENSIVGPNVVLGKNVLVGKGVQIENSIIFSGTRIGDFSFVERAIIGEGVEVGENVRINRGCIVGDKAKIEDNVSLGKDVKVCPGKEVYQNILESMTVC